MIFASGSRPCVKKSPALAAGSESRARTTAARPLPVVGLHSDPPSRPTNLDAASGCRQAERIGDGLELPLDLLVRVVRGEANLLRHGVLELVEAPIDLADVDAEI